MDYRPAGIVVNVALSRQLERERDEARREAIRWQDAWMNETPLREMGGTLMPWLRDWNKSQENETGPSVDTKEKPLP
jgi:hypothetical protein